ncbi:MAG: ATP-binding protein [Oscillospiraceae bacterium]|nr:ATP-binding protein [Oscillospiraceae bacterium]
MGIASSENVLRILTGYNHWWQLGSVQVEYLKPVRRTVCKEAMKILNAVGKKRSLCIVGPRRTGKTTILHQLINNLIIEGNDPRKIVYMNVGHPFFSTVALDEILSIYFENIHLGTDAAERSERVYFFFDDIQLSPDWEENMTRLTGVYPNVMIVASGTVIPSGQYTEKGPTLLHLPPMSFYEYCQVSVKAENLAPAFIIPEKGVVRADPQELRALARAISPFRKQFGRYMYTGGFPKLVMEENNVRVQSMIQEAVINETLLSDIPAGFNIRGGTEFRKLFLYLCLNCPGIISYDATAKALDCLTRLTVEKYTGYIERASLIYLSNPADMGGKANQKIQPKIYLADAAMFNAMMILDDLQISPEQFRNAVETTVYRHLRFFGPDSTEAKIDYYRERGRGIDMVLSGSKKLFVDVRYSNDVRLSRKDPIVSMADRADFSLIVTKKDSDFGHIPGLPENLFLIPAHILLFLIGKAKTEGYSFLSGI